MSPAPPIALLALALVASASHAEEASGPLARDYRADSPAWNGLSGFVDDAAAQGCKVVATDRLDWPNLGPHDVLFFVYPQSTIDAAAVGEYLEHGGRLLLADDFGAAGPALEALQLHRTPARLEGVPRESGHPELPVARANLLTTLGRATTRLVANHPASLETALPATFAFSPGQALVVEGKVGLGRFVALADPSVLINNMLELDDDRAFARALVTELCDGKAGDRVSLFTGAFSVAGATTPSHGGARTVPRVNELLHTLNRAAGDLLEGQLGLPSAIVLCSVACILAWTILVRSRGARHADGRFARGDGIRRLSPHAVVDALPRGERADHRIALLMLRAEVLRRVARFVGPIPSGVASADLSRRVRAALGDNLGRGFERFLAVGPPLDAPAASASVSRGAFARALRYARPILDRTQEHDVQP